uniref:Hematopoietic SH2 domain-containing protein homolog n=1 Tax=Callorhinchus milii TaxID=7868 RepID=A0A4W3JX07_CALMI
MARSEMRLSGNPAGDGFAEGQAIQGMSTHHLPEWLHGNISRRHAEELLQDKPLGCFLVRFSESRNGYTFCPLNLGVVLFLLRGPVQFRHFMIDVMPDARCIISGETRVHRSLQELVSFHTHVPIRPYDEYLTVPCGQTRSGEPCSLSPALGKERLTSPSGCFSAANIAPLSPSSASPAAAKPLLLPKPLKFQAGTLVPPPLPSRKGLVVSPGAQLDPTIPSRVPVAASDDSRGPVKKLYPSLQSELRALLQGNQIPTPKAVSVTVSFANFSLLPHRVPTFLLPPSPKA